MTFSLTGLPDGPGEQPQPTVPSAGFQLPSPPSQPSEPSPPESQPFPQPPFQPPVQPTYSFPENPSPQLPGVPASSMRDFPQPPFQPQPVPSAASSSLNLPSQSGKIFSNLEMP